MGKKIKLLVYTSHLGGGGAEKHLVRILNHFDFNVFDIHVVTTRLFGEYEKELNENIKITKCGFSFPFRFSATVGRISTYFGVKKVLKEWKPDLFFSIQDIHNVIALKVWESLKKPCKIILGVQNSVLDKYDDTKIADKWVLDTIKNKYHLADKVIALSLGVKKGLLTLNSKLDKVTEVIYNAGYDDDVLNKLMLSKAQSSLTQDKFIIIACGRLTKQKGYKYLLPAFQKLYAINPTVELWILGSGELEVQLKQMSDELGIAKVVKFLGFKDNPFDFFTKADLFVLSSEFEGFGNVIVEAMISQLPIVSTDCPHGPNEILEGGKHGVLVDVCDSNVLFEGIKRMVQDENLRQRFILSGYKRAEKYHAKIISNEYQKTFKETLNR